jgi:hypothetical protein
MQLCRLSTNKRPEVEISFPVTLGQFNFAKEM